MKWSVARFFVTVFIGFSLFCGLAGVASAAPPLPYNPWGTLTINGQLAPGGVEITARIHGLLYASTTTASDGSYSIDVPADDCDTPWIKEGGMMGETVAFKVGGRSASPTGTFTSDTSLRLDLTVILPTPTSTHSPVAPTNTPSSTATPTSTPTDTPMITSTATPAPTSSPTAAPSATPSHTPVSTDTPSSTPTLPAPTLTNTPTPSPTASPTPTTALADEAVLLGHVDLQGRPPAPDERWVVNLAVELRRGGSSGVAGGDAATTEASVVVTDEWGHFSIGGISPGTYDIWVDHDHTLSNVRRDVVLAAGDNTVYLGELQEGDATGDGMVDIDDFGHLKLHFSTSQSIVDFNQDQFVDIDDFGLLKLNFGEYADIVVTAPEP